MRQIARGAAAAAAATLLGGCFWPALGAGPGRTAHNGFEDTLRPATVGDLEELWSAPVDGVARYPVTSRDGVHVVAGTTMYGVDSGDGTQLWERDVEAEVSVPGHRLGPMVGADTELITGHGTSVSGGHYATDRRDAATGEVIASLAGSGLVEGVRGDGYVLVRREIGGAGVPGIVYVTVADDDDPSQGWTAAVTVVLETDDGYPQQSVTLGEDHLYQAGPGFFRDGDGVLDTSVGVRGFLTTEVDDCGIGGLSTACPEWFVPFAEVTAPPVLDQGDGVVYAVGDDGTVMALDGTDGTSLWSTTLGDGVTVEPALADGVLYVATAGEDLVALDASDGSVLWEAATAGRVGLQPAVAGGVVYTAGGAGLVEAFDAAGCGAQTCSPLWSDDLGSDITGAPAIDRGQLYVGTRDGRLVAYGLSG